MGRPGARHQCQSCRNAKNLNLKTLRATNAIYQSKALLMGFLLKMSIEIFWDSIFGGCHGYQTGDFLVLSDLAGLITTTSNFTPVSLHCFVYILLLQFWSILQVSRSIPIPNNPYSMQNIYVSGPILPGIYHFRRDYSAILPGSRCI